MIDLGMILIFAVSFALLAALLHFCKKQIEEDI